MRGQWLGCLMVAEHVTRRTSAHGVFDVLIDAWPVYRRTCQRFAFLHSQVAFMDAEQNVLLHSGWNDYAVVVQDQAVLLVL